MIISEIVSKIGLVAVGMMLGLNTKGKSEAKDKAEGNNWRIVGWILMGVGLILIGVLIGRGIVFVVLGLIRFFSTQKASKVEVPIVEKVVEEAIKAEEVKKVVEEVEKEVIKAEEVEKEVKVVENRRNWIRESTPLHPMVAATIIFTTGTMVDLTIRMIRPSLKVLAEKVGLVVSLGVIGVLILSTVVPPRVDYHNNKPLMIQNNEEVKIRVEEFKEE